MADEKINVVISGVDKVSKVLRPIQRKLNKFSANTKKIGKTWTRNITLPILATGAASIKMSIDMNKSMANVATLIPGASDRVKELKTDVQNLAIQTGKSTGDISDGLFQVISAFGDTADTTKLSNIQVKAATAGQATVTEALKLTAAVTKAYGDTSALANEKVADLAFTTNKLGQTTFPELAQSIGQVTPLTKELGIAQESLFGIYATATGVTGDAAKVSTQFKGVLQSLLAPTKDMTDLFGELKVKSGAALIEQVGLAGAIKTIVQTAKLSNMPLQKFIGSIEGQTLALAMAGPQYDVLKEKTEAMRNSTGAMTEAFNEQQNGINKAGVELEKFKQFVIVAGQRLGDKLAPGLVSLGEAVKPVIKWLTELSPITLKIVGGMVAFAAIIGPVIAGVGILAGSLSAIIGIAGTVATVAGIMWAAITGPVGLTVIAIAAVVGAGIALYKNWEWVTEKLKALWGGTVAIFKSLWEGMPGWLKPIITTLGLIFAPFITIPLLFLKNWEKVTGVFNKIKGFLGFGGNGEVDIKSPSINTKPGSPLLSARPSLGTKDFSKSVTETTTNRNTTKTSKIEIELTGEKGDAKIKKFESGGNDLSLLNGAAMAF